MIDGKRITEIMSHCERAKVELARITNYEIPGLLLELERRAGMIYRQKDYIVKLEAVAEVSQRAYDHANWCEDRSDQIVLGVLQSYAEEWGRALDATKEPAAAGGAEEIK